MCLVFIMGSSLFAQTMEELQRLVGQQITKQERKRTEAIRKMRRDDPVLAKYEEELLNITKEIRQITADYAAGKISKNTAATRLRPFIKRSIEINSNHEYLTEKQLYTFLQSAK